MRYGGEPPRFSQGPGFRPFEPRADALKVVRSSALAIILIVIAALALSGCSFIRESPARTAYILAAAADTCTTVVALNRPGLRELNPLGAATGMAFKFVWATMLETLVKNPETRTRLYWSAAAAQSGFATHNARELVVDIRSPGPSLLGDAEPGRSSRVDQPPGPHPGTNRRDP